MNREKEIENKLNRGGLSEKEENKLREELGKKRRKKLSFLLWGNK